VVCCVREYLRDLCETTLPTHLSVGESTPWWSGMSQVTTASSLERQILSPTVPEVRPHYRIQQSETRTGQQVSGYAWNRKIVVSMGTKE
jgi:hypothetical protein